MRIGGGDEDRRSSLSVNDTSNTPSYSVPSSSGRRVECHDDHYCRQVSMSVNDLLPETYVESSN